MTISKLDHARWSIQQTLSSSQASSQKIESIKWAILDLLTIRDGYFHNSQKWITPLDLKRQYNSQIDWYNRQQDIFEKSTHAESNPAWIWINCYTGMKSNQGYTIKMYRSIPIEEYSFISHLWKLKSLFEVLSRESWDYISFKFPRWLLAFLCHRDSLVVHFQKKENIDSINQIIDTWMQENSISRQNREWNRSELAVDHSGMSFSELIAMNYAFQIVQKPTQLDVLLDSLVQVSQKPNF